MGLEATAKEFGIYAKSGGKVLVGVRNSYHKVIWPVTRLSIRHLCSVRNKVINKHPYIVWFYLVWNFS